MFIQDYLTLKVLKLTNTPTIKLKHWDKVVYEERWYKYIWTYIWYDCEYDYEVSFLYKLNNKQLERFYSLDKKAKDIYYNVKDDLKLVFPNLKFVIAKMNFTGSIIYIYFYSEDRVDFRPYLQEVKQLIWMNFFLYQVWARDRVRLHPESKNICWSCWQWLCCTKHMCKIPSVETSTISLQSLQTQSMDSLKWVCWKLKCCLKYEEKIYEKELEAYPELWSTIEKEWKIYTVIGVNVLMKYIFVKDQAWFIVKYNFKN